MRAQHGALLLLLHILDDRDGVVGLELGRRSRRPGAARARRSALRAPSRSSRRARRRRAGRRARRRARRARRCRPARTDRRCRPGGAARPGRARASASPASTASSTSRTNSRLEPVVLVESRFRLSARRSSVSLIVGHPAFRWSLLRSSRGLRCPRGLALGCLPTASPVPDMPSRAGVLAMRGIACRPWSIARDQERHARQTSPSTLDSRRRRHPAAPRSRAPAMSSGSRSWRAKASTTASCSTA